MSLAQITMGLEIVLKASLGGAGYTVLPMLWSGSFTAARIPLAAWLAGVFGLNGVWIAIGGTAVGRGSDGHAVARRALGAGARLNGLMSRC